MRNSSYIGYIKIKVMMQSIKQLWAKAKEPVLSFLFIGAIFYMYYVSVWIFCPC